MNENTKWLLSLACLLFYICLLIAVPETGGLILLVSLLGGIMSLTGYQIAVRDQDPSSEQIEENTMMRMGLVFMLPVFLLIALVLIIFQQEGE